MIWNWNSPVIRSVQRSVCRKMMKISSNCISRQFRSLKNGSPTMVGNFKGNAILTGPRNQLYRRPPPLENKIGKTQILCLSCFEFSQFSNPDVKLFWKASNLPFFIHNFSPNDFAPPSFMLARNLCPPLNFQFGKYHSCHPHPHRPPTPSKKTIQKIFYPYSTP